MLPVSNVKANTHMPTMENAYTAKVVSLQNSKERKTGYEKQENINNNITVEY